VDRTEDWHLSIFDKGKDFAPVYQTPAGNAVAVTPNANDPLTNWSRGIYVGGAGNINVVMALNSATVVYASVAGGSLLPIRVSRVIQSGTTATGIVAVW
jgi:hypothetical protein